MRHDMRFVLDERYDLLGWKNIPFVVRDRKTLTDQIFTDKQKFLFLFNLSGKKEVERASLEPKINDFLQELLDSKKVREASGVDDVRTISYTQYDNFYRRQVHWSITGRCNYKCKHCFQLAPEGVLGQPTLEQCFNVISQMRDCGIASVGITGGEPLIRSDFFQIVDELIKNGIGIDTIYSNGKLINQKFLDELKKRDLKPAFQISFDGVGFHDWMRGTDGAEQAAIDAFKILRENDFPFSSAMCLCKKNIGALRETVNFLAQQGCKAMKTQVSMQMGEWKAHDEDALTQEEGLQAYLDYLPKYAEDGMPLSLQMEGYFSYIKNPNGKNENAKIQEGYSLPSLRNLTMEKAVKAPLCGVLQSSFFIGPNGAVVPCMSMCGAQIESIFPNVFKMPLKEILTESSYTETVNKRAGYLFEKNQKCHDCEFRCHCCGGCRACAVGDSSTDYFTEDTLTCNFYKGGWHEKFREVSEKYFSMAKIAEEE